MFTEAVLSFDTAEKQVEIANWAVQKSASVRDIEKMAKAAKKEKKPQVVTAFARDSFYDEVALSLKEALGRQVKVNVGGKGGTLQIEFFDPEDLRYLAKKLAEDN